MELSDPKSFNRAFPMIFVGGIHGVGKSRFCAEAKRSLGMESFTASQLITDRKQFGVSLDKLVPDIEDNQQILLQAVQELSATNSHFLIDGHFCLLTTTGQIARVPSDTFNALSPEAIVVLTEQPEVIATRLMLRDGIFSELPHIHKFQMAETAYATEVAEMLGIPLKVAGGAVDVGNALDFLRTIIHGGNNGRQV